MSKLSRRGFISSVAGLGALSLTRVMALTSLSLAVLVPSEASTSMVRLLKSRASSLIADAATVKGVIEEMLRTLAGEGSVEAPGDGEDDEDGDDGMPDDMGM